MLWFFIVLAITVLAFIGLFVCERFELFELGCLSVIISIVGIVALLIMACVAIDANTDIDAYVAQMQRRYEVLVYQLENDVYENDNDVGKRELYEDIRRWNEDLAKRKECQDSPWVGMFYADVYNQFEFIPLR